jgi:hypothetical protein
MTTGETEVLPMLQTTNKRSFSLVLMLQNIIPTNMPGRSMNHCMQQIAAREQKGRCKLENKVTKTG